MFAGRFTSLGMVAIFALFLLSPSMTSFAATQFDPQWRWFTLQGEHFNVHFHDGEEAWARIAMAAAERAHQKLTVEMNWTPDGKTEIVLADKLDISNGGTMVYPFRYIELYMALPTALDLIDRGDYFEKLILHEYAHVLHLDMARGGVRTARKLLGRHFLLFPNQFQPFWGIEGIATYHETDPTQGVGRGQSSFYAMMMRTEVMNGLKPLSQVNQVIDTWPGGTVRYLYGVEFFKFLEARYGKEKIEALTREYSDNIVPFFVNLNFKQVLGKRLTKIWPEFEAWLQERYRGQENTIRQAGVVEGQVLTKFGGDTGNPRVLGDGSLYFIRENNLNAPMLVSRHDAEIQELATLRSGAMFDVHKTSGFILAQPEWCDNVKLFFDLYTLPLQGGEPQRLTKCARLRDPAWRPDGEAIVAVQVSGLINRLVLLGRDGQISKVLWQGETDELIHRPAWSPDGKKIAAALWRKDQGMQIWEFNLEENQWAQKTEGDALHFYPSYTPQGDLLYTSDEEGVFDIYLRKNDYGQIQRLTRVTTGAFMPVAGGEGRFYYQGYGAKGYDIYHLQAPADTLLVNIRHANFNPSTPLPSYTSGTFDEYSPWSSLRPRWWMPLLSSDLLSNTELLVFTGGRDTLWRHSYFLTAGYNFGFDQPSALLTYKYDRYNPILSLEGESSNYLLVDKDDKQYWELHHLDYLQPNITWLWRRFDRSWQVSLDEILTQDRSVRQNLVLKNPNRKESFTTLSVSTHTYRYDSNLAHSPNSGYRIAVDVIDQRIDEEGSTGNSQSVRMSYKTFVPFDNGAQFALTLGWGYRKFSEKGDVIGFPIFSGLASRSSLTRSPLEDHWLKGDLLAMRRGESYAGFDNGDQIIRGAVEFRSPMGFVERGIMVPPIALQKYYASTYVTGGRWQITEEDPNTYKAVRDQYDVARVGVELNMKVSFFYGFLPLWYSAGAEYDLKKRTTNTYFRLESELPL